MDEPLIWNNLDDAAGWLAQATGKTWTVRAVLDAEIKRVRSSTRNGELARTWIKAAMPRGTSFGRYRLEKGRYIREGESGWSAPVPLSLAHLHELLLHGTTRVGLVQSPDDDDKERGYIFIDPIDEGELVFITMTGIRDGDLKSLLAFITCKTKRTIPKEEKPMSTKERDTLLTIIAAFAKEAKIDISRPSKAAGLIEDMTQLLGAPVAKRTIEEKLKLINDALERRGKP